MRLRDFTGGRPAVYSDVVSNNLILPKKEKYTITDFKKLVNDGWDQLSARFIVSCSAGYYNAEISRKITSGDFRTLCELGLAMM